MYPLGKQFEIDTTKSKSEAKCMYSGNNYRISVISDRCVRLEYSPNNQFIDNPTQLIKKRNLGMPDFLAEDDGRLLTITTKYFVLSYVKGQPFGGNSVDPTKNLKITLRAHDKDRQKDWYYGHPEVRNMAGNIVSVDFPTNRAMQRGLFSLDGFVSLDDSHSRIVVQDGTLIEAPIDHTDIYVFM